ncbi:hypothetical protein Y1Q_0021624 [Alligator mississippiensis]|uniref:Uncharacterized protein n=1 Tax=Alligator mississippiensis TaxID=8496 RepID=A0A151PAI2_ALLMI|nr:hypothetical protein Y1Q_0021624 [Alligator mississippiensis]
MELRKIVTCERSLMIRLHKGLYKRGYSCTTHGRTRQPGLRNQLQTTPEHLILPRSGVSDTENKTISGELGL